MNNSIIEKIATSAMLGLAIALMTAIVVPSFKEKIAAKADNQPHDAGERNSIVSGYTGY